MVSLSFCGAGLMAFICGMYPFLNGNAVSYNGDACAVGFGAEYTFEKLRNDAAQRWSLDVNRIVLQDGTKTCTFKRHTCHNDCLALMHCLLETLILNPQLIVMRMHSLSELRRGYLRFEIAPSTLW
jgi:hypothetical protein